MVEENKQLTSDVEHGSGAKQQGPTVKKAAVAASIDLDVKKRVSLFVIAVAVAGVLYLFLSGPSKKKEEAAENQSAVLTLPEEDMSASGPQITNINLPAPANLEVPLPPPPPPVPPDVTLPPNTPPAAAPSVPTMPELFPNPDDQRRKTAKMRAGIMVYGGGSGSTDDEKGKKKIGFLSFDNGNIDASIAPSAAASVAATKVMNPLDRTILQGKVIEAVLETAINTNLPTGMIRAVVTRDVYAEQGKHILIAKGSRVVGQYSYQSLSPGNLSPGSGSSGAASSSSGPPPTRVSATWSRVMTPSGIDVAINSPATDRLGRAGIPGSLDDQWLAQLGSAVLVSYVIPFGIGKLTNTLNDPVVMGNNFIPINNNSNNNNPSGGGSNSNNNTPNNNIVPYNTYQTTSGAMLLQNTTQQFQSVATEVVQDRFNTTPVLTINQGTKIMILVQQDLVFSEDALNDVLSSQTIQ